MDFSLDDSFDLQYEENVPQEANIDLSDEVVELFVQLFWEELLERCSDLFEGFHGPPG